MASPSLTQSQRDETGQLDLVIEFHGIEACAINATGLSEEGSGVKRTERQENASMKQTRRAEHDAAATDIPLEPLTYLFFLSGRNRNTGFRWTIAEIPDF